MSIGRLRFWSQKVLPLVYDESLSYYEVLNKMRFKINEIITGLDIYQIKFADPIYWDITKQYEPYTIVKDEDGVGYLSKQPVPAGIAISNQEYWQSLGVTPNVDQFVINVADYGVLGVEGADYTAQLQEALTHGNVFYFPEGTYSFKGVTINKPTLFFGEGEKTVFKPLHRIETSNQYATMIQSSSDFTIDGIKFVGDNSITTQTGDKYLQTAIVQQFGHKFRMTNCVIDEIYDTYHLGVGVQQFYERNGLLLYVNNADRCEIDHCTFKRYGGEELTWISRDIAKFADATPVLLHDNIFKDRIMQDSGGIIDGGSVLNVLGGDVYCYNNIATNYYERGSFMNLLGNNVNVFNNKIINSDMTGIFDMCEGYYIKANSVHVYNNYQEDRRNVCNIAIKALATNISIHDNHFEAKNTIRTFALLSDAHVQVQTYKASDTTWTDYDYLNISNNELVMTNVDDSAITTNAITINQNNQSSGSRSTVKNTTIKGNVIARTNNVETYFNSILSMAKHDNLVIDGNKFSFAGASVPSSSRKSVIGFYEPLAENNTLFLTNNSVDDSVNNVAFMFLSMSGGSLTNALIFATGNVVKTGATFKVLCSTNVQNLVADYNLNFSANQG